MSLEEQQLPVNRIAHQWENQREPEDAVPEPRELLLPYVENDSRRLRLVVCACLRRLVRRKTPAVLREAITFAEDWADGQFDSSTRDKLCASITELQDDSDELDSVKAVALRLLDDDSKHLLEALGPSVTSPVLASALRQHDAASRRRVRELLPPIVDWHFQMRVIREVFGPSESSPATEPWSSHSTRLTVLQPLARSIYERRAFNELPILADALEEAGCVDRRIIDHCREHQWHMRGCWVIDLVRGQPRPLASRAADD